MLAKVNTQITGDSLLSLEKISIGGVDTVRGYREAA
jgi:hemolysin activation/secretion protein